MEARTVLGGSSLNKLVATPVEWTASLACTHVLCKNVPEVLSTVLRASTPPHDTRSLEGSPCVLGLLPYCADLCRVV